MHYFQMYSTDLARLNVPLISHEFSVNLKSNRELSMYVFCHLLTFFIHVIFAEILKVYAPQANFHFYCQIKQNLSKFSEVNML